MEGEIQATWTENKLHVQIGEKLDKTASLQDRGS
jgi:hypothetical protein